MTVEEEIQEFYIKYLQANRIDFLRIKNQSFKGKSASYKSTAVFEESQPNDKYFPDIAFPLNGVLYLREFGTANKDRKKKQLKRGQHWEKHAKANFAIITTLDQGKRDMASIMSESYKVNPIDEKDQITTDEFLQMVYGE